MLTFVVNLNKCGFYTLNWRIYKDKYDECNVNKWSKFLFTQLIQMQEELDENVRIENQSKKKAHKLHSELGDTKIHLEEVNAKNHDLEKKQRK